jgi:hypothetical protein
MICAHQPGSEPIDIPETIPNPVVGTSSQGANSSPGEGSLEVRKASLHTLIKAAWTRLSAPLPCAHEEGHRASRRVTLP